MEFVYLLELEKQDELRKIDFYHLKEAYENLTNCGALLPKHSSGFVIWESGWRSAEVTGDK